MFDGKLHYYATVQLLLTTTETVGTRQTEFEPCKESSYASFHTSEMPGMFMVPTATAPRIVL
jgi:hypothetical protein